VRATGITLFALLAAMVVFAADVVDAGAMQTRGASGPPTFAVRSLDGSANNPQHPTWGQAGTQYARQAPPNYADGKAAMVSGPPARAISNRIFNDTGQNIFSQNDISQWGWAWGQFIDHDMDLRDETPAEAAPIGYDKGDPLESFANEVGHIDFARTPAAPGTGTTKPRQQINTISSFIDASQVYGTTQARLKWLRRDNSPDLLLPDGYLPRADARGDAAAAPKMDLMGALASTPALAVEAGDVRANENFALTALQTLFAREHNRIADVLPASLGNELRFQIARRIVGAEIQYVTHNEFLPTLGVRLDSYRGYNPRVSPSITNEFATVGYRAHSMVHGEFESTAAADAYSTAQLDQFNAEGITIEHNADGTLTLVIPLAVTFGNPDLLQQIGLKSALQTLGERQYANDEQIDNSMRSILFQIPEPGTTNPAKCGEPVVNAECYSDIADLGADDVQRGRDHGMPTYNALRRAYGLPAVHGFTQITGETTDAFPPGVGCNDPASLAFTELRDENGNVLPLGDSEDATSGVRRSTLAARLKCLYGTIDKVEAFVGMVAEKHVAGTEFGPLQLAIWRQQFTSLRNGDRFFYGNDRALQAIQQQFGLSYRHTLGQIIALNDAGPDTGNVFKAAG
jgi:Animal haem peroxidase